MNLIPGPHNDVVQVYIEGINGGAGLVPGRPGPATFDGFYAPVDNQPTTNKAKAGQTIPLKWRVGATSFATSWEDYYPVRHREQRRRSVLGRSTHGPSSRSSSRLAVPLLGRARTRRRRALDT